MTRKLCSAVALLACLLFLAAGAYAQPICIGLQEAGVNLGAITNEGCPNVFPSSNIFDGSYGTFDLNLVTGAGAPSPTEPGFNTSDQSNVSTGGPGTIFVYLTAENEEVGGGIWDIASTFTSNLLTSGWSATEQVWVSPIESPFQLGTLVGQASFTSTGTTNTTGLTPNLPGPPAGWSETEVYEITANGAGSSNLTIDTAAVPEPASLAMLGSGLLGLAGVARRRFLV